MSNIFLIFIAILLIFLNGVFVAAEFAIVKIRNSQINLIKKSSKFYNKIMVKIHARIDTFLSACQLGITLTSLGLGWIGEPATAFLLQPIIAWLHISSPNAIETISFAIAFIFISFLHIVAGELLPKSISIRHPWETSLITGTPLYIFYYLTFPAIWILNSCSNFLLRLILKTDVMHNNEFYSTQEIKFILHSSRLNGEITPEEAEIMEHTMDFAGLRITEVMRPKDDLICLNINSNFEQILPIILENKFSRYPVYDEKPTNIVGLLHVKDLFINNSSSNPKSISQLVRPILKISSNNTTIDTLKKFKNGGSHLALIYRGKKIVGFLTLDNLLHILIGKIKDEFHHTKDDWVRNTDNSISVDGDCSIYSLEQALDIEILANEEGRADNVHQLIINQLGRMPYPDEIIQFEEFKIIVKEIVAGEMKSLQISTTIKSTI